ncbi:MAG TPA: hypothetical protein VJL36_02205 [Candidatus Paceibacterota bacterium]
MIQKLLSQFASRRFFNYFWISILISVINIIALWLLIDFLDVPTLLATTLVIGSTFIGRYILFNYFEIT